MFGQIGHMIVNSVVIYPITQRILMNKKVTSLNRRKLYAFLFLGLVGLCSIGFELIQIVDERNLFKIMQVPRTANQEQIKKSYQRLARELHPDKNMAENAEQMFIEMKEAYEILSVPQLRNAYDIWGYDGLDDAKQVDGNVYYDGAIRMAVTYCVWFALTILITAASSSNTNARTICIAFLAMIFSIDVSLKTSKNIPYYIPFFSHLGIYQITQLLFTIYPTWISGTIIFQNMTYVDPVERNWQLISLIFQRQALLNETVTDFGKELRLAGLSGAIPPNLMAVNNRNVNNPTNADKTSGLPRNLQAKNNTGNVKDPSKNKFKLPSYVFFIGMYILFNYVLK